MAELTSIFDRVLNAVIDMAQATDPYADIVVGSLPANNGLSMTYTTGGPMSTDFKKGISYEMSVVLNGKHSSQSAVLEALAAIHRELTRTKIYPRDVDYQINDIATISAPVYLEREQNTNAQWLYGSSLRVRFYYFGGY